MIRRSHSSNSSTPNTSWLRFCLLVALVGSSLVQGAPRPQPQLASSEDAECVATSIPALCHQGGSPWNPSWWYMMVPRRWECGNTVIYSAGTDAAGLASTTILSTALAATAAEETAAPVQDPASSTTSLVSQNLGQDGLGAPPTYASTGATAAAATGTSTAPPTTYLVYYTVNGVQTSGYSTFSASFAPTPSPQAPMSGSVLQFSEYLPSRSATTGANGKTSGAEKSRKAGGAVAGIGMLLCVGLGAVMLL